MHPAEFWPSTPREIINMARGARWRERREWERLAWTVHYIMSPHAGRKTPSIKRLISFLGADEDAVEQAKKKGGGLEDKSPESIRAFIDGIAQEQKKHAWMTLGDKYAADDSGGGAKE